MNADVAISLISVFDLVSHQKCTSYMTKAKNWLKWVPCQLFRRNWWISKWLGMIDQIGECKGTCVHIKSLSAQTILGVKFREVMNLTLEIIIPWSEPKSVTLFIWSMVLGSFSLIVVLFNIWKALGLVQLPWYWHYMLTQLKFNWAVYCNTSLLGYLDGRK